MVEPPQLDYAGRDIHVHYVVSPTPGRSYNLIEQGLQNHPKVRREETVAAADFIFLHHQAWNSDLSFPRDKLVFIDFSDDPFLIFPVDPVRYFKRSWPLPASKQYIPASTLILDAVELPRLTVPQRPSLFQPLPYAVMDEFIVDGEHERFADLSCFLRPTQMRRALILKMLGVEVVASRPELRVHLGPVTESERAGFDNQYLQALSQSRIVVTSGPDLYEGDSRTWEALANGACVIQPWLLTPVEHPLVDGVHTAFFDGHVNNVDAQSEFLGLVFRYLSDPDQVAAVGRAGREHALRHHRAANRVDWILRVLTGETTDLT